MHIHTAIYSIVFLSKMYLDFLNDRRLRYEYFAICNIIALKGAQSCSVDDLSVASPLLEYVIPDVTLGIIKLIMDVVLFVCGIVFFLKFRNLKKKIEYIRNFRTSIL